LTRPAIAGIFTEGIAQRVLVRMNFGDTSLKVFTAEADGTDLILYGYKWTERFSLVDAGFASIATKAESDDGDWYVGHAVNGWVNEVQAFDANGRMGAFFADDAPIGSGGYTDPESNVWTTTNGQVQEATLAQRVNLNELNRRTGSIGGTVDVLSNVAADRILGRITSGSGNSEELTAAQVRTILGDPWVTITDTTLGSAAANFEVDTTGYSYLDVMLTGLGDNGTATVTVRVRFNGDTGNNYLNNTGSATSAWNAVGSLPGSLTNTNRNGIWSADINLGGTARHTIATYRNAVVGSEATTGLASSSSTGTAYYTNLAAAITAMSVFPSAGNWAAGTRLLVRGRA
jgi:hypothetical protein